jgi:hypothetical protein
MKQPHKKSRSHNLLSFLRVLYWRKKPREKVVHFSDTASALKALDVVADVWAVTT